MHNSIDKNIQRIQRLKLSCSINDNGKIRHFHCGREYVEIGGIKWATCNVGAEKPIDSGLYFAWGETQGYTAEQVLNGERRFNWGNYKYETDDFLTKYNDTDKKTVLELSDDAAAFNMGVGWRMPTKDEFWSLIGSTTSKWVENYEGKGVNGMMFVDKADHSMTLFFPAFGYCAHGNICYTNEEGIYLSSVRQSLEYPYCLSVSEDSLPHLEDNCYRCRGFQVRGVVG